MPEDIEKLKFKIGYDFQNKTLLKEALTHRSYAVENSLKYDNQRLEFLGDAVLEIIMSEYLFNLYADEPEGNLTKMRSAMVRQEALAQLARHLELGDFLLAGRGELENGGNQRESTLSDLFEALLGAYYLDAGFVATKEFVLDLMRQEFPEPKRLLAWLNPKGMLQEYAQHRWGDAPEYDIIEVSGPDHDPDYEVEVKVDNYSARGIAQSRKLAESQAAKNILLKISEKDLKLRELL